MKVKFIKDHFSGIKEGSYHDVAEDHGARWIKQGYCEEVGAKKAPKKDKKKDSSND